MIRASVQASRPLRALIKLGLSTTREERGFTPSRAGASNRSIAASKACSAYACIAINETERLSSSMIQKKPA